MKPKRNKIKISENKDKKKYWIFIIVPGFAIVNFLVERFL